MGATDARGRFFHLHTLVRLIAHNLCIAFIGKKRKKASDRVDGRLFASEGPSNQGFLQFWAGPQSFAFVMLFAGSSHHFGSLRFAHALVIPYLP